MFYQSVEKSIQSAGRWGAMIVVAGLLCVGAGGQHASAQEANLAKNGGFESGESGWMWQQWKGKPLPGFIDRDDMHEGLASFMFHQDGVSSELYMAKEIHFESDTDYTLSFAIKTQDVPEGASRVRLGIDKRGWYGASSGKIDIVKTGGTHGWKEYSFNLPASALSGSSKLTVFFYHDRPDTGTIGIDALTFISGSTPENTDSATSDSGSANDSSQKPADSGSKPAASDQEDLVHNGGFESGEKGWGYQQWKGKPLPGYIDKDDMYEGLASFKLHQDGVDHELYMSVEVKLEGQPSQDYALSVALKAQDMPENAGRIRLLIDGYGWFNKTNGRMDFIKTGGTHDWKTFTTIIPADVLKGAPKARVFIYHDKPSQGELGIDALSFKPVGAATDNSGATSSVHPKGNLDGVTYATGSPVVLLPTRNASVMIRATPEKTLYRTGELPAVTVNSVATPGATLVCKVLDGFGVTLLEKNTAANSAAAVDLALPAGHGYYEVVAALQSDGQTLSEARRSIGVLDPPAEPVGDEPFGLWVQGAEHYPELGVRWTREGINWSSYQYQGEEYLASRLAMFKRLHSQNIKVLAFPKHPHPNQTSREVIEDTPEAWRALEEWWTHMVKTLGSEVDAWGVVNEPITGHWKGTDPLIVRYWTLMRKIVDRYDPGTPLVGPCLGMAPSNFTQYEKLMKLGFASTIDAVELHTYITSPEDNDWEGTTRRFADMTKQAVGKDLPIWSSEHGTSATYELELLQAQHLMRSWLVAKKIGYPVVIWHMFSHPQGSDMREISFGIFRNGKERGSIPQPRPAGLAYGVMTRQLAGATYKSQIDYLGPSIYAYVFERDGKAMAALWTTSQKTYDVTLSVGNEKNVTQTGLFGRVEPLEVNDGLIHVTVDRNPRFISPLPDHYLSSEPIAQLDKAVEVLPGQKGEAVLTIANPTQDAAEVRIEWLSRDGWELSLSRDRWTLQPKQGTTAELTVAAPQDMAIGRYQVYGKVFLNGKFVTSLVAPIAVQPQVELVHFEPSFDDQGCAVIAGMLHRIDSSLQQAQVQLAEGRSDDVMVSFSGDEAAFKVPVKNAASDHLESVQLVIRGMQDKVQLREDCRLSFVPATRFAGAPKIDGEVTDWQAPLRGGSGGTPAVAWGWDDQHIYLAVQMDDPTHIQTQMATEMWKDDSLQIGVAPGRTEQLIRDFLPGLQEAEMFEFDVALGANGPAMYRHRTMNKHTAPVGEVAQEQIRYVVKHRDGVISYELQIPVEQVGLKPLQAGLVLRTSLLINANEGAGRKTTEWFGGIHSAKDPSLFGHLILTE